MYQQVVYKAVYLVGWHLLLARCERQSKGKRKVTACSSVPSYQRQTTSWTQTVSICSARLKMFVLRSLAGSMGLPYTAAAALGRHLPVCGDTSLHK